MGLTVSIYPTFFGGGRYHKGMTREDRSEWVRHRARQLGFARCGIAPAGPVRAAERFEAWLAAGLAGSMSYLHRYIEQRRDPRRLLDGARSVVMCSLSYFQRRPASGRGADGPRGRIARYAWGADYHQLVKDKLWTLLDGMNRQFPEPFEARVFVDTAPLLEKALAAEAGIGWIGKNTLLLDEQVGSFTVLGAIVTTLALEPDPPALDECGTCTRCLQACPTGALRLDRPYQLDARRCISYLSIEHRGAIDESLRPRMGRWLFGCDICQDVCPFNRRAAETTEAGFAPQPPAPRPDARAVLEWTAVDCRRATRGRALDRATRSMLRRNAAVVLGNVGTRADAAALRRAAADGDALVADHARWAMERIETRAAREQTMRTRRTLHYRCQQCGHSNPVGLVPAEYDPRTFVCEHCGNEQWVELPDLLTADGKRFISHRPIEED